MIFKGLELKDYNSEPIKIEIFFSSYAGVWTVQMKDENGNQFENAEYEHRKEFAIESAKRLMKEYATIKQIDIFTKQEKLQRSITK